ncbi:MAG TPA: TRAFs-binding domain-containing protein [Xanthobacteraceae bacterium]|nr:TRAFs-binding domain-containing protein [Xanthobacteraceae bacterium]
MTDPDVNRARKFIAGEALSFVDANALWKRLKTDDQLSLARLVLRQMRVRPDRVIGGVPNDAKTRTKLCGEEALLMSKDPELNMATRHDDALKLLRQGCLFIDDETLTGDGDTFGIAGGICKRRWNDLGQLDDLLKAAKFYERGTTWYGTPDNRFGDDAYPHINAAFVEDLLAAAGDDPVNRRARAVQMRKNILEKLKVTFRAASEWKEMIRLASAMPEPLRRSTLVQEQLSFALNRAGDGEKAEQVLLDLIRTRGPSSETYGLLGRVYKDRWDAAVKQGDKILARGLLDKAIEAYLKGFETDWRDAFPGINAATLMTVRTPPDGRLAQILPVVRYAVERKIAAGKPDYWDHATMLELAVLAKDENAAMDALVKAVAAIRETWEPETTARNLRLIHEAREARGEVTPWATEIEEELKRKAKG